MREGSIRVCDINLHYAMEGRGPDSLLIHGWVSSGRMWAHLSSRLAASQRCWALDLPGCGDSDKPPHGWYSIPNYTTILREFMRAVGIHRAHVVGHSMGGMIALDLAATYPDVVERLIAINPVVTGRARPRPLAYLNWDLGRPLVDLTLRVPPKVFQMVLGDPLEDRMPRGAKPFQRRTEDFFKGTSDSVLGSGRATLMYDVAPKLSRITAPTLVILGDLDVVVPNSEGRLAAAQIPDARLEVVRAGHLLTDDLPARTAQLVWEFLA